MTRHLGIATAIIGKTNSQWWAEDKHRSGYQAMAAFGMAKPITFCDSASGDGFTAKDKILADVVLALGTLVDSDGDVTTD